MIQFDASFYRQQADSRAPGPGLTRLVHPGVVRSVLTDNRLQVRIAGIDDARRTDAELPICAPLFPPHLNMGPAREEVVTVLLADPAQPWGERYWLGPSMSQVLQLPTGGSFPAGQVALSAEDRRNVTMQRPLAERAGAAALWPEISDPAVTWILGRGRSDVRLGTDDAEIRSGKHEPGAPFTAASDAARLRLVARTNTRESSIHMEAELLHLLGRLGEAQATHPAARADLVIDALRVVTRALLAHRHPGPGLPPVKDEVLQQLLGLDLERLGSPGVLIN